MQRHTFVFIAAGLALLTVVVCGLLIIDRPTTLRVAVVRDGEDQNILAAAAQTFAHDRASVRLKLIPVDTFVDTAAALVDQRADMAVVRSDIAMPPVGLTTLIMRHNAAILIAPGGATQRTVGDLAGTRIGILRGPSAKGAGNLALLNTILAQYDVPLQSVKSVPLALGDLAKAFEAKEIDAVMTVGVPGSGPLADIVATVAQVSGNPVFIPVSDAPGIAQRSPAFEALDIVRGVFGGARSRPATRFETLGVTTRLVAKNTLSDDVVSEVTRLILAARPTIALQYPLANRIEAPGTDKGATLPIHPGAAAYLDDEEQTFFDKYSDAIYIGAMCLSVLGSAAAALVGRLDRHKTTDVEAATRRLFQILESVRGAEQPLVLDGLEKDVDDILAVAFSPKSISQVDPARIGALGILLSHVRHALSESRQRIADVPRPVFEARLAGE